MGRKRRNNIATTTKGDGDLPTAVGELFVALLDLVGFFTFGSGDDRTTRQHLVQSLKFLSAELQALQSNDRENTRRNDESSFRQLLLVEDEIAGVRRDATAFLETIVNERSEFFALSQDIESSIHFQKRELGSWLLFNRSLVTEYRIQSQMEELMATRCLRHTLDSLYSVDRCETEVQFQQLIQCLSREALIRMPQFREGVALVRQLVLQEGNVMHGTQIDSNAVVSRESADESLVEANYALADDAILQSHTIGSACEVFFRSKDAAWYTATPKVTAVLVVGSEGSGKTHLCNEVERLASLSSTSLVIRPRLPLDLLKRSVGETEDVLVSLGDAIVSHQGSVLLLLDNVEHLFGNQSSGETKNHQLRRCQSTVLGLMDYVRKFLGPGTEVLMIFTASSNEIGSKLARFDGFFRLEPPNRQERKALISSLFLLEDALDQVSQTDALQIEQLVLDLVELVVDKSYAELIQYCRQSIESVVAGADAATLSTDFYIPALIALRERLQTITPDSLRTGVIDDYVDMRVMTARDLLSMAGAFVTNGGYNLPLRGNSAANAWKALQSSIIIPLCRSKELYGLLDESSSAIQKSVIGAILLTGEPGSGKTEIAIHCATHAAQLLPSVTLIDVSCTSLIHKEVGGSEKAVHHLFDAARRAAPCIILMDCIENIAAVRGNDNTTEGTMDRVLSTLLVELDGVEDNASGQFGGIAVIGITQKAQWIDSALKRPGRLNRAIHLSRDWI